MKPHKDVVIGIGVEIRIAAQRLCCEQTVLLVSASHKLLLNLSNQADSSMYEYCASSMQILLPLIHLESSQSVADCF